MSIITPSFNCAKYIARTIESIQAQSYRNWELLITDDCSTDNSTEIIEAYASADSRIKLFRLEKNSGAGVARNKSIEHAKGELIAFCDSDDLWLPAKLESQVAFMEQNKLLASYSSYLTCSDKGNITGVVVAPKAVGFTDICSTDNIGFLTFIYDASKLGKHFMPAIRKRQDWALKIKILHQAKIARGMRETLAVYRQRDDSLSNKKFNLIKYNVRVYREVLGLSSVRAWIKFLFDFMPHYMLKRLQVRIMNR